MSHRRNQGRFVNTSTTEALQRQLSAPVYKWTKAWVSPNGLAPESSYKICKWVRIEKAENGDDDDFSEGHGGDDEEMGDGEGLDDQAETPMDEAATPSGEAPLATPDLESGPTGLSHAPLLSSGLANPPLTAELLSGSTPDANVSDAESSRAQQPVPSNAIEMSNIAPGHTELGQGDLAGGEVHLEVSVRQDGAMAGGAPLQEDVVMGEDAPGALENDAGLVHGEMEPPEAELAVEGGDHPPTEVER